MNKNTINKIIDDPKKYATNMPIKSLVNILQKMSDAYYGAQELVNDEIYDIMYDVLKERDPDNSYFFQTGVKKTTNKDVTLPYPMPSLNKIKPTEKTLERWFKTYTDYVIMDKLDGISIQIFKNNEGIIDIFTKKQTGKGTSKIHLLKYLITNKTLNNIPNNTSIRGELVIAQKDFNKLKDIYEFKNPRSMMASFVNVDKIDTRIAEKAQFIAYSIISPRYNIEEQLKILTKWGFKTVWYKHNITDDIEMIEPMLINTLIKRRASSEFLIDGLVIADNATIHPYADTTPKHTIAFKINSEENMKDAIVEDVEWNPTMYGYLQPVIRIKPIILDGNVTVTYVSAHNAKYVLDNKIGKGSIIKIIRSGDVIPYIVSIVKHNNKADMPDMEYVWNDTKIEIIAVNPSEEILNIIHIKQNAHFFKKIGVKHLSEGIITKLHNAGYKTIQKILEATKYKDESLYEINGLGEKIVTKIYNQIDKSFKNVKMADIMAGSLQFGRGIGAKKLSLILKKYPNILDYKNIDEIKDKILLIDGFSDNLAEKFANNLSKFHTFLISIQNVYDFTIAKQNKKTKGIFINQQIVLTGIRSEVINNFVENNGGKISSSVSKNTTLLIYEGESNSSKIKKAIELNIKMISYDEFMKQYKLVE